MTQRLEQGLHLLTRLYESVIFLKPYIRDVKRRIVNRHVLEHLLKGVGGPTNISRKLVEITGDAIVVHLKS